MAKMKQADGIGEIEVHPRKLRNGNRIKVVIEMPYTEKKFAEINKLNFKNVEFFLKEIELAQPDLENVEGEEESTDE